MDSLSSWILTGLFLLMAVLYSSVGQGGGSGYLAAMALMAVPTESMRLTALSLNIVVAAISVWKFAGAGFFDGKLLLPFVLGSVPAAFLGGALSLPPGAFKPLVGVVLWWAAVLLLRRPAGAERPEPSGRPSFPVGLVAGAGIGLLSGLIGIGGGIFLAPLLILRGWASAKVTAAVSSAFILVNSVAGLAGVFSHFSTIPPLLFAWGGVVALGGWVGSHFGANRLSPRTLYRILAAVLILAGGKIILAG
jgi:uncharacterized membrane protein YfcA